MESEKPKVVSPLSPCNRPISRVKMGKSGKTTFDGERYLWYTMALGPAHRPSIALPTAALVAHRLVSVHLGY